MAKSQDALKKKLDEIRSSLMGSPTGPQLAAMQLQLDALEKWARVSNMADADHQHNHMDDHDNTAFVEPILVMTSQPGAKPR